MARLLLVLVWTMLMAPAPAVADTLELRIRQLEPAMAVTLPADLDARVPVVVMLHGCGGRGVFLDRYAAAAAAEGWASVIVDSYAHRGIGRVEAYSTICTGFRLWGRERAGDLYAALEWVRRQPWADPARIVVAGWSHGGWTALDALVLRPHKETFEATGMLGIPDEPLAGVVGAFLVYPYCGTVCLARTRPFRVKPRTVAVLAGADRVVGVSVPRAALERQAEAGAPLTIALLDGATHAFDEPEARDLRSRYDPDHTARAHALLRELLRDL